MLVANTSWYHFNFRLNLALAAKRAGADVTLVSPPDRYVKRLEERGLRWVEWSLNRRSIHPLSEAAACRRLKKIYQNERPDLVHHHTVKCVVYGTMAARRARVSGIVNSVTGLGHLTLARSFKIRLLRPLVLPAWRWALTRENARGMLQNEDDLQYLLGRRSKPNRNVVVTNGSGIDLHRFHPDGGIAACDEFETVVLFVGRLLREKGIYEFVEVARRLGKQDKELRFVVCGAADAGNPSSVDENVYRQWRDSGMVEFLGHVEPIDEVLRRADIVVLPSYREGLPRTLLEAAAMAKPVVATDTAGCRDAVVDGETGLLVPVGDVDSLAEAIQMLANRPDLRRRMGRAGRQRVVELFNEEDVIAQTLQLYRELLESG